MSKFFISCNEATTICDKNQYKEARFIDKLKLTIHLLLCKLCKCYSKQNSVMSKVYDSYTNGNCKKDKCLCEEDKRELEEKVLEKIEQ